MFSYERYKSYEAILLAAILDSGLEAMNEKKSDKILVPPLNEIASSFGVSRNALKNAAENLQSRSILSKYVRSPRDGYVLQKPEMLLEELSSLATGFFQGRARSYVVPPHLRKLSREAQLLEISKLLSQEDLPAALMHSAYLLPSPLTGPYKHSRVLRTELPICLSMTKEGRSKLVEKLNLLETSDLSDLLWDKKSKIHFGPKHGSADLVIFETRRLLSGEAPIKKVLLALKSDASSIMVPDPVFNSILLRSHPVRGLEQSEALLSAVMKTINLKS